MKKPNLSLCLIVKPSADEAKLLDRCLSSVARHVDEICITITGESPEVEAVCKKYHAKISHIEWHDDFAEARNFNFAQATGDYILWLDADDTVANPKSFKKITKAMRLQGHHGIIAWYNYGFDKYGNCVAKHKKTRLIKNEPGLWSWGKEMCELHEDLIASRTIQQVQLDPKEQDMYFEVDHLSFDERFAENAQRNIRISRLQAKKYPNDPRAYWNLANSLSLDPKLIEEAIVAYSKFLKLSKSDDEKYLAHHRMALLLHRKRDNENAIMHEQKAIALFPWYPDAHVGLGAIFYALGKLMHAKEFLIQGMSKQIPENIIVMDPMDYTENPLVLLADIYFRMGKPEEARNVALTLAKMFPKNPGHRTMIAVLDKVCNEKKEVEEFLNKAEKMDKKALEEALKALPSHIASDPSVCFLRNSVFIRETAPKNEVVIDCGFTEEQWGRHSEKTGIGGSEEAVLNLSKLWAKEGKKVIVYGNFGHKETIDEYGVTWRPYYMFNIRDAFDTLIIWRHPEKLDRKIKANRIFVDMHDVLNPAEFSENRLKQIDKVFFKSRYHRSLFPTVPEAKAVIISNGINLDHFTGPEKSVINRVKHKMVYTSSPDRGLEHLLDAWPEIIKAVPDATLDIYYGWGVFDSIFQGDEEQMNWKKSMVEKMKQPGITFIGRVGHEEIAKAMLAADVYAYPCHFEEIDCISMKKAIAAGMQPVVTAYAAVGEYGIGAVADKGQWKEYTDRLIATLKGTLHEENRHAFMMTAEQWSWDIIAKAWLELL